MEEKQAQKKSLQQIGSELLSEIERKRENDLLINQGMIEGVKLYWDRIFKEYAEEGKKDAGREDSPVADIQAATGTE